MNHPKIKKIVQLIGLTLIVVVALLFAVFTGDQGPWYFAWAVGTIMIILIACMGAILLDTQEEQMQNSPLPNNQKHDLYTTNTSTPKEEQRS